MADPTSPFVIGRDPNPFLGFNDNVPMKLLDSQASALENGYVRTGKIVRRMGTSPFALGDLSPTQDIDGLQWTKVNGTEYLVAAFNGNLYNIYSLDHSTGLPNIITNSTGKLSSGTDINFAWVAGNLYGGDGIKQNIRFNGTNVIQSMVDKPVASGVVLTVGGAGNLKGTYQYKIAFINGDGVVGEPSSGTVTIGVNTQSITLSNIPICPAGEDCIGRAIYRFGGNTATYNFIANINDNTTTTLVDNTADTNVGALLITSNTRFPPCRYFCEWQSRLVGAYCTTSEGDKQTVFISNFRQPYYCPVLPDTSDPNQGTQEPLQDPAEGTITGLHVHGTQLVVFTGGACYTISGTQPLDFQLFRLFDHGCVAHRTIQSTHDLLIWLGWDGVYAWIGGDRVERISDQLYNTFISISAGDLAKSWSFIYDNRYYVGGPWGVVYLDLGTRFLPAAAAAIYLDTGKWPWGKITNWPWRVTTTSVFTPDTKNRIYGAQIGHGRVWQAEIGNTDNGAPINLHWASKDLDFGQSGKQKRLQYYGTVWTASPGIATINLYRGTGELIQTTAFNTAANYAVTGMIRASYLGNPTASRQLDQCVEQADDEYFRLDIQIASTSPVVELLQVEFHLTSVT